MTDKDELKLEGFEIDFRFVRECERLEREGWVENRVTLEKDLGMNKGRLVLVRNGKVGIGPEHIRRLKIKYNGNVNYILFGTSSPEQSADELVASEHKKGDGYYFRYAKTAAWQCGPRPEEKPEHYPLDPLNTQHPWHLQPETKPMPPVEPTQAANYPLVRLAVEALIKNARHQVGSWFSPKVKVMTDSKDITDVAIILGAGAIHQEWYKAVGAVGWRKLAAEASKTADAEVTIEATFTDRKFSPITIDL